MRAAEDADSGIDPALIGAISIHESGWSGPYGFGIVSGRGGYRADYDVDAAVADFISLVQQPRYAHAWAVRGDNLAFLNAICDAGYAGPEGRAWAPKIIWLRTWMLEHPDWRS